MNEQIKQAYLDKSSAQLKEWEAKVDVVKAKVAQGAAVVRIDYHSQIERWQEQEQSFKLKLEELRATGVESFETMKSNVQNIWNEIGSLIQSLEEKHK